MPLKFLHLSDLHLRERDATSQFNPDADLRNELLLDLERIKSDHQIGGVLVTGDLAFAGKPNEYSEAANFLRKITDILEIEPDCVWVVPGNHDIDRSRQTPTVKLLHKNFREAASKNVPALDHELRLYLEHDDASPLFAPLASYNAFADLYGCRSQSNKLAWQQDFSLAHGWTLRVHGLNSALISNADDNQGDGRLILGSPQWRVSNQSGVCHLVMCHHPLDWLFEYEDIEDIFEQRIQVLLCGHKHRQRVRHSNYTKVYSGALHPDRHEDGWDPRYNVVSLEVICDGDSAQLEANVYERQYDLERSRFTPVFDPDKEAPYRNYSYALGRWQPPVDDTAPLESSSSLVAEKSDSEPQTIAARSKPQGITRSLLYRFYNLAFTRQMRIISDMRLFEEGDELGMTQELLRHALERVKAEGQAAELDEEILKHEERR